VSGDGDAEFALLRDNAREAGLPWRGAPVVRRVEVPTPEGTVSALLWGEATPSLVLLHGGAQNAHTWDTVALALGQPLAAIDLPGHGHSQWRADRDYWPRRNAATLAGVIEQLAAPPVTLVGMSLGGLTAVAVAASRPDLVRSLVVVDVTPGVDRTKAAPIAAFVEGPEHFTSFEEMLARTVAFNPTRTEASLRRGVVHNARELPDGRWAWRYDRLRPPGEALDFGELWDDVSALRAPVTLVLGALSGVVDEADVAELLRRQPDTTVITVEGAGHSIQGDRPVELAAVLERLVRRPAG
jgi:pimeloyl-ACP methyl ester carboxylesterase